MWHRHDYDMKFHGTGLGYYFECRCGDRCTSMEEASLKQGSVRMDLCVMGAVVVVSTLLVVAAIWVSWP